MESNDNIKEFTCNDCQEVSKVDWSKVRPDLDDGSSNIEICEKGNGYAYYGECMNCGNLVEIEPPVPELVVDNVDVDKNGMFIQVTDKVTNRSCWIEAWKSADNDDWDWDFNQYIFHLDDDSDVIAKMFQEDLGNYGEELGGLVLDTIYEHEDEYNKLQENKAPTMRDRLKEVKTESKEDLDKSSKEIYKQVVVTFECDDCGHKEDWTFDDMAEWRLAYLEASDSNNEVGDCPNCGSMYYNMKDYKIIEENKKVIESDKVDYSKFTPTGKVLSGNKGLSQKEIDEMRWSLPKYFKDMTDEQKQIWTELSLRGMVMSCLVYGDDIHTATSVNAASKYYRRPYVDEYYDELGKDVTEEIIKQQTEYFKKGKVIHNTRN